MTDAIGRTGSATYSTTVVVTGGGGGGCLFQGQYPLPVTAAYERRPRLP